MTAEKRCGRPGRLSDHRVTGGELALAVRVAFGQVV